MKVILIEDPTERQKYFVVKIIENGKDELSFSGPSLEAVFAQCAAYLKDGEAR